MSWQCKQYVTTYPAGKKRQDTFWLNFVPDDGTEKEVVNLYPEIKYQTFEGFGGAFTDSAGYIYSLMPEKIKQNLMDAYFGEDGLGYLLGRVHLDSCDFSLSHYAALADPADKTLETFSMARGGQYILPMLYDAQKTLGREIPLMAAPWSPPAFMKTNKERNFGGKLLPEYRALYADYLCRHLLEMREKGAKIVRLTTQNEPKAVQTWDSCIYTAEEEAEFLKDYLHPALVKHGLSDVDLFIWDHNKERVYERTVTILESGLKELVAGIAFHWYGGDHFEALDLINARYPEKQLVQTEACIEYEHYSPEDFLNSAQKYAHDIIGDLNGGMTAFYDWNLVLDEIGGPNHVKNFCDAPLLYHAAEEKLEERASFAYIGHFSKHIRPGARRIAFSKYCGELEMTAFEGEDKTVSVVFLNRTKTALPAVVRIQGEMTRLSVPEESIVTLCMARP